MCLQSNDRLFSERLLAQHDGSNPDKPIYLAVRPELNDTELKTINWACLTNRLTTTFTTSLPIEALTGLAVLITKCPSTHIS